MLESPLVIIADINILLPLLFGQTQRAKFLRNAWRNATFRLALTPQILDELARVVTYTRVLANFGLSTTRVARALEILKTIAIVLPGNYAEVDVIEEDPSDNIYLAAALESGADYLVTQDRHILSLKYFYGTQIISLDQFVRVIERI
jgi:putative PIN family toxin of toxin-antitoxin system